MTYSPLTPRPLRMLCLMIKGGIAMKLIVATKNAHKLVEFKRILTTLGYEVLSQADVDVDVDVEETGTTFEENSRLKAKAIFDATGMTTVADDSGLEVDYLNGEPGIYSARYGGEGKSDRDRCELVLEKLTGVPKEERTARFVCVIHMIFATGEEKSYRGECEGYIGTDFVGDNGFGYDPIFMVNEEESFATLDGVKKDAVSHRGRALKKMEADLKG